MKTDAFITKFEENRTYERSYYMNPARWEEAIGHIPEIQDVAQWTTPVKYMDSTNTHVSDNIKELPEDTGGIYMFFIQGPTLPFIERYIAYIGRAQYTESQNIRKRANEYFAESQRTNSRPKIANMFKHWKPYLFFQYFPCRDNSIIQRCEANLIHAIIPPFNDDIPDRIIVQNPQNAF